jgi:hypothetical protein
VNARSGRRATRLAQAGAQNSGTYNAFDERLFYMVNLINQVRKCDLKLNYRQNRRLKKRLNNQVGVLSLCYRVIMSLRLLINQDFRNL